MNIGLAIRQLREASGLRQMELASRVGVSSSMLSLVEHGKREPTLSFLRRVARALDVPSAVLFACALADADEPESPEARVATDLTRRLYEATIKIVQLRSLKTGDVLA